MASTPLANVGISTEKRCILCNESIVSENYDIVKEGGLETLRELAKRWERLE